VRTVKGVDIWENGEPDRPYVIVGVIDSATLPTSGVLLGAALAAGSEGDMVNVAKKNGGDAVILVSEQTTSGGYNATVTPDYFGGGTVAIRERVGEISKVLVVKYVGADGQNTHSPQAAPAQPSAFDQAYQAGMIAIASKDFKAAIESFHNAVTLDSSSTLAWTGLSVAHDRSHDFSDAMYCYQVALNLNPSNPAALAGLERFK
jgi:hypothetical protein